MKKLAYNPVKDQARYNVFDNVLDADLRYAIKNNLNDIFLFHAIQPPFY